MFLKLSIVFVLIVFISHCHTKPVSNKSAHISDEIVSIFIIKALKLRRNYMGNLRGHIVRKYLKSLDHFKITKVSNWN